MNAESLFMLRLIHLRQSEKYQNKGFNVKNVKMKYMLLRKIKIGSHTKITCHIQKFIDALDVIGMFAKNAKKKVPIYIFNIILLEVKCRKCHISMNMAETNETKGFWYPTGFCDECLIPHHPNSV